MNTVEALTDIELIKDIADYLKEENERNFVLFMTGIHLGRRISDMLNLKVRDVKNKDYLEILHEGKTSKYIEIAINPELKDIYKEYCRGKRQSDYLFPNERTAKGKRAKPISRQRVWQILNAAADYFEYERRIGCHTLRKTFGYWLYQDNKDITLVQEVLNHSDPDVTKRYIGLTKKSIDTAVNGMSFLKRK